MGGWRRWFRFGASLHAACPHPCPPPEGEGGRQEPRACMRHCGAGIASRCFIERRRPSPPLSPRGEGGKAGEGCEQAAFHLRAGSVRRDGRLLHCSFPAGGRLGWGHDSAGFASVPHRTPLAPTPALPQRGRGKDTNLGHVGGTRRWYCLSVLHRTPSALTPALSPSGEGARQGRGVSRLLFICAPVAFDGMGGCCIAPSPAGGRLGWGHDSAGFASVLDRTPLAPTPALPQRGREKGNDFGHV